MPQVYGERIARRIDCAPKVERMSIPSENPELPATDPVVGGSPYGPAGIQPPPYVAAASVPPRGRSSSGWVAVGVILLFLSLFSFPKGLVQLVAAIAQGGNVAYALGGFMVGATFVTVGVLLLVKGAQVRRTNREALAAELARLDREATE